MAPSRMMSMLSIRKGLLKKNWGTGADRMQSVCANSGLFTTTNISQDRELKAQTLRTFSNTHIEAIMGHIWRDGHVIVAHGLVDVLVMFDQDSLGPHVLFCPAVKWGQGSNCESDKVKFSLMKLWWTGCGTYMCWRTLEQREGSTFCQQPRWAAALCSRSQYRGGSRCLMRMTEVLTDTRMKSSQDQRLSTYCVLWRDYTGGEMLRHL